MIELYTQRLILIADDMHGIKMRQNVDFHSSKDSARSNLFDERKSR